MADESAASPITPQLNARGVLKVQPDGAGSEPVPDRRSLHSLAERLTNLRDSIRKLLGECQPAIAGLTEVKIDYAQQVEAALSDARERFADQQDQLSKESESFIAMHVGAMKRKMVDELTRLRQEMQPDTAELSETVRQQMDQMIREQGTEIETRIEAHLQDALKGAADWLTAQCRQHVELGREKLDDLYGDFEQRLDTAGSTLDTLNERTQSLHGEMQKLQADLHQWSEKATQSLREKFDNQSASWAKQLDQQYERVHQAAESRSTKLHESMKQSLADYHAQIANTADQLDEQLQHKLTRHVEQIDLDQMLREHLDQAQQHAQRQVESLRDDMAQQVRQVVEQAQAALQPELHRFHQLQQQTEQRITQQHDKAQTTADQLSQRMQWRLDAAIARVNERLDQLEKTTDQRLESLTDRYQHFISDHEQRLIRKVHDFPQQAQQATDRIETRIEKKLEHWQRIFDQLASTISPDPPEAERSLSQCDLQMMPESIDRARSVIAESKRKLKAERG